MTDFRQHFLALDELLCNHRHYWHSQPFVDPPPWAADVNFLDPIDDEEIYQAQADDKALLRLFQPCFPELCASIEQLCEVATVPDYLPNSATPAPPFVPGRKWQQIERFALGLVPLSQPTLEWCCGKGHLSRHLSQLSKQQATGLEIDSALVDAGNTLAQRTQQPVNLQQADVLEASSAHHIAPNYHVVGLHACGGLHRSLLQQATRQSASRISYSPCCYHKFQAQTFQPLSPDGQGSALQLTHEDLRTAVRQNSTAGSAERRRHHQHQRWRLGFDLLQRELRECDEYLPTPTLPVSALKQDFEHYCRLLAQRKALPLREPIDFSRFERRGAQRYAAVMRQELLRALFRRPLELWLVLDQILFLQEGGYRCELISFCPQSVTPRNLLIDAKRQQ